MSTEYSNLYYSAKYYNIPILVLLVQTKVQLLWYSFVPLQSFRLTVMVRNKCFVLFRTVHVQIHYWGGHPCIWLTMTNRKLVLFSQWHTNCFNSTMKHVAIWYIYVLLYTLFNLQCTSSFFYVIENSRKKLVVHRVLLWLSGRYPGIRTVEYYPLSTCFKEDA